MHCCHLNKLSSKRVRPTSTSIASAETNQCFFSAYILLWCSKTTPWVNIAGGGGGGGGGHDLYGFTS